VSFSNTLNPNNAIIITTPINIIEIPNAINFVYFDFPSSNSSSEYTFAITGFFFLKSSTFVPFIINNGNISIAILSFGWNVEETIYAECNKGGCAPREKNIIIQEVAKAKKEYKRVVVCIHWGFEYNRYPITTRQTHIIFA
jgi:hypothetical protein